MHRVLLYSFVSENVRVTIEAFFDEDGNLIIEGYDIGKTVEEYWGDSDYEYTTTIPAEEVPKLFDYFGLLPDSRDELLTMIQSRFNSNHCYSQMQDFLVDHDIKYKAFSWA